MDISRFLLDLVARLFKDTPKFFQILRNLSIAIALLTGLPAFLASNGIDLPDAWDVIASKVISIGGIVAAFISQLTVTNQADLEIKDK